MAGAGQRLGHEEVVRDPFEVGEGSAGLTGGYPRRCGSAERSRRREQGPVVAGGAGVVSDGLFIGAELMEALAAAWAEGIWRRRRGPEVDGAGSGFGKKWWTGAQLLAVVAGSGARRSGSATGRRPQQRKRTTSLLRFLAAGDSWLGDGAHRRAEEEARHESAACGWRHSLPAATAASGAGARDGAELVRVREEEAKEDFSSSNDTRG
jgi:hypothetical protein